MNLISYPELRVTNKYYEGKADASTLDLEDKLRDGGKEVSQVNGYGRGKVKSWARRATTTYCQRANILSTHRIALPPSNMLRTTKTVVGRGKFGRSLRAQNNSARESFMNKSTAAEF